MSYAQMAEFNDFLIKVRMDKDCRVIVLTGEGRPAPVSTQRPASIRPRTWAASSAILHHAAHVLRPDHQHAPLRAAHHRALKGFAVAVACPSPVPATCACSASPTR
ncbi:MAG: hypothetical protein ACLTEX_03285 [Eggerthella lenta]